MTEKEFNHFLISIDQLIHDLKKLTVNENKYKNVNWDFTEESIEQLDKLLEDSYSGKLKTEFNKLVLPAIAYYGDVFIKNIGGKWILSNQENQTNRRAVLGEFFRKNNNVIQDPYGIVMSIKDGRKNVLSQAYHSAKNINN